MPKHYTVSDGELVLFLWPAEEGGYNVTSPLDSALITQADNVEEAFVMARDAWNLLKEERLRERKPAPRRAAKPGSARRRPNRSRSETK
jgi:predicted RNase H-like HicB family nuclease